MVRMYLFEYWATLVTRYSPLCMPQSPVRWITGFCSVYYMALSALLVGSGLLSMRKVERRNAGTELWNVVDGKQFKIEFSGLRGTSIEI